MSRMRRALFLFSVLLLGSFSIVFAQSQATTGVIEGTVSDEGGGVLPGAAVTLRNTATNYEQVVTTGENGRFRGVLLPLGPYRITVTLDGYATLVREGLDLAVGQTINLPLTLKPGLEQEITVTGEAPVIETSRTEGAVRIDTRAIENLPNNGRNFLDYTKLTPGVTVVQGPDGDELSINGQKGIANNISVDGADFNNPFFGEQRGGQRPPFTFNLESVQEVVVVADGAPAEFGRSSGGFVNVITKSGTNQIKGSGHAFYIDDSLSSTPKNPDGSSAEEGDFDRAQGGFTLGGPLVQDKVFYFIAADAQRSSRTKQTNPNRMDPRLVSFLASIGLPDENGPIERTDDAEVALAKIDWQASDKHLVTFRYSYTNSEQVNGTFDVDQWGRSANGVEQDYSHAGTATVISTLSSNLLNEVRAQYAKEWRPRPYEGPNIPGQNRPFPDTAILFNDDFTPNGARWGMPFFLPVKYNDDRKQLTENLSYLRDDHSFKAGVEYNEVASSQTFVGFANGRFVFLTTSDFINYVNSNGANGTVLLYLQQAGVGNTSAEEAGTQTIRQREPAVYVQDTWKPRSNLTIDYGLRWEALDNPDVRTPPSEVFFAPFIGQTRNGQEFPSNGEIPDDYEMWQPRLGLSWVPDQAGKSVVRATAGVYHARLPALNLASTRSTNGSLGQTLFRATGVGTPPPYTQLLQGGAVDHPDVFVYDKDWQTPRTISTSLSYEREVWSDTAGLVKLNYAKTDHITRFTNRNDPRLGSPWSTGLPPGGANGIATLTTVESTAKSRYRGITLGLDKRLTGKYAYQVYYTWSKDKSDDDNERDPFTFRYADITQLDREYSYSDRDQRHRINAWALFRLPADLDLNLRYSYRSAQPKSIKADGTDAATPQARINPDGSVTLRNLGRKDNEFNSLDLRLSRAFSLGNMTLEPVVEVFNVFDEPNFLRPQVTELAFNFDGTVRSGAGDPRQIQVGLRLLF
ncbi:MAG TPA: carboxypeptidase regulatory-like domain-containing protein [Thermoanaerobaculia bacterium]|nr:carboxypeptidase regulatory-like domain-containing protein [Thermoanaerobaculia bacterium]